MTDPLLVPQSPYNATVVQLVKPHDDLMILRVRPDGPIPPHQPGQYTTLGLGAWEPRVADCQPECSETAESTKLYRRSYSLSCSILDDTGELLDDPTAAGLEFYITLVRQTEQPHDPPLLTPRLFGLRQGDRLHLGTKISGQYTLQGVQPDDTVIFLSTGTGEAPHNYMLWQLLRSGHRGPIVAVCCVRYRKDLGYRTVHETLGRRYPHYRYVPLVTREGGPKRYIQDLVRSRELEHLAGRSLAPQHTHFFLCGNPAMIGAPRKDPQTGQWLYPEPTGVVELLEAQGHQIDRPAMRVRGNIHFEKYW
ncbi:MAG: ferredoxin--NADP reductase [Gemmataceae bacterium]